MLNLFIAGALVFGISLLGYRAWTRPERPGRPSGYALGTIRGTQFGMALGSIAMAIGFLGLVVQAVQRIFDA